MEQPYAESDAQMIRENSIDNGHRAGVLAEPLAEGPDLAATRRFDAVLQNLKLNPWISIAAAGASALAVGFIVGRLFKDDQAE